jgi:S-adenosylmethionine decarboxylase
MDLFRRNRPAMAARHRADPVPAFREHSADGTMVFGAELVMDLDGCEPSTIADPNALRQYAVGVVDLVGMKRYGAPMLAHFGHADPVTSGYTLVQLIETSSLVAHFSEMLDRAHINLFSCRDFDAEQVIAFSRTFFRAERTTSTKLIR